MSTYDHHSWLRGRQAGRTIERAIQDSRVEQARVSAPDLQGTSASAIQYSWHPRGQSEFKIVVDGNTVYRQFIYQPTADSLAERLNSMFNRIYQQGYQDALDDVDPVTEEEDS